MIFIKYLIKEHVGSYHRDLAYITVYQSAVIALGDVADRKKYVGVASFESGDKFLVSVSLRMVIYGQCQRAGRSVLVRGEGGAGVW